MKTIITVVAVAMTLGSTSIKSQAQPRTEANVYPHHVQAAQNNKDPQSRKKQRPAWLDQETTVFILGNPTGDELIIKERAMNLFQKTQPNEYQGVGMPRFMITDRKARATFAIGGFINLRTAYDVRGIMSPTVDFVPYQIPMTNNPLNGERFLMSANTSRLYFRTVIDTKGGPLEGYVETDFRGAGNSLRLRQAYIKYYGFKLGQAVTTFSDPNGSFNTIDFEGPNGYTYGRNLMVQYTHEWRNGFGVGLAMEYPVVSATYAGGASAVYQRVPDVPAYLQYSWGKFGSHIRASGIIRNMFYANNIQGVNGDQLGWGAQLSGSLGIGGVVKFYGQFLYGEGITPYIADLQGTPYDMMPNPAAPGTELSTPMMGWLAGLQFNLTKRMPLTIGYSQVTMFDKEGMMAPTDYNIGQYVVGNLFYKVNRTFKVGVEYLYGTRTNFNGDFAASHRIQTMVQLNF